MWERNQIRDWNIDIFHLKLTTSRFFAQIYQTISKTDSTYSLNARTTLSELFQIGSLTGTPVPKSQADQLAFGGTTFTDDSKKWNGEIQYNNEFGDGFTYVVGGQFQQDNANSNGTYLLDNAGDDPLKINQVGIYAQLEKSFSNGFKTVVSARYDNHDLYGTNIAPKVGLLKTGDLGTWRLTYGKGIAGPPVIFLEANIFGGSNFG